MTQEGVGGSALRGLPGPVHVASEKRNNFAFFK